MMEEIQKPKNNIPRYQQIALEIASRIASGEYAVGEKIYARSSLASQYGVSPETARRAVCILCDLEIVTSEKGSGVTIQSQKKAVAFMGQYNKRQTLESIKENLLHSVAKQQQEMENINTCLADLLAASEHFRSMNPFMPFELRVTKACVHVDQTLSEIQFWQHTGATVLAVRRKDAVIKSPGPYMALREDDILYFLTQDDTAQSVREYLYPSQESSDL